jgi:hypothetical protein
MRPGEPDWVPLEAVVGPERCDAFMFIAYAGPDDNIRLYKHVDTRLYLNLDPDGNAYVYDGTSVGSLLAAEGATADRARLTDTQHGFVDASGDSPTETYHPIPLEQAIARVFGDPDAAASRSGRPPAICLAVAGSLRIAGVDATVINTIEADGGRQPCPWSIQVSDGPVETLITRDPSGRWGIGQRNVVIDPPGQYEEQDLDVPAGAGAKEVVEALRGVLSDP